MKYGNVTKQVGWAENEKNYVQLMYKTKKVVKQTAPSPTLSTTIIIFCFLNSGRAAKRNDRRTNFQNNLFDFQTTTNYCNKEKLFTLSAGQMQCRSLYLSFTEFLLAFAYLFVGPQLASYLPSFVFLILRNLSKYFSWKLRVSLFAYLPVCNVFVYFYLPI